MEETLSSALPGLTGESDNRGRWQTRAGAARWELEPAGDGFWLVLSDFVPDDRSPPLVLKSADRWPWPLKVVRDLPGGRLSWCGELRLTGSPDEVSRLARLVDLADVWLAGRPEHRPDEGAAVEGDTPDDFEPSVREALGRDLPRSGRGFRLAGGASPAIEIQPCDAGIQLRSVLATAPTEAISPPLLDSLLDLLAVANIRLRGLRAVWVREGVDGRSARLETRIDREDVSVPAIRAAVDLLADAGGRLATPCQIVCEMPEVAEAYKSYLLGVQAA